MNQLGTRNDEFRKLRYDVPELYSTIISMGLTIQTQNEVENVGDVPMPDLLVHYLEGSVNRKGCIITRFDVSKDHQRLDLAFLIQMGSLIHQYHQDEPDTLPSPLLLRLYSISASIHALHYYYDRIYNPNSDHKEVNLLLRQKLFNWMNSITQSDSHSESVFPIEDSEKEGLSIMRQVNDLAVEYIKKLLNQDHQHDSNLDDLISESLRLASPTHILMREGGDERITVSFPNGANKYYTSTIPHHPLITSEDEKDVTPNILRIERSSCTSSSPVFDAFCRADGSRQSLLYNSIKALLSRSDSSLLNVTLSQKYANIRDVLSKYLHLDKTKQDASIVFTPSGSDAEMILTLLALNRNKNFQKLSQDENSDRKVSFVHNIVVAGGEVGTGTPYAAGFSHFSKNVPSNLIESQLGLLLEGVEEFWVKVTQIPARDVKTGVVKSSRQVEDEIRELILKSNNKDETVILHVVHSSKTGLTVPRIDFVKEMKRLHPSILDVVDAAQLYMRTDSISIDYIDSDFCILATGSKFFASASFTGAVIIPHSEAANFMEGPLIVPEGLHHYFTAFEVDEKLVSLRSELTPRKNYGLLLRWETAAHSIKKVHGIPQSERDLIFSNWFTSVRSIISEKGELVVKEFDPYNNGIELDGNGGNATIICITLLHHDTKKPFNYEELRVVHKLLSLDLTSAVPIDNAQEARASIIIGQPVKLSDELAIVRIALSAPAIINMWQRELDFETERDLIVVRKLLLVANNFSYLSPLVDKLN